jgi:uncharacterized membrane protein YesL
VKGICDMAGFLGLFDFTKPGPGVPRPEETTPKNGVLTFFEILGRKFWKIISIGMMFFIFNIPAIIVASFAVYYFVIQIVGSIESALDMTNLMYWFAVLITIVPIINIGPFRAGFEGVFRNYAREEHSFIWSDFKEHIKSNLKQSLIISFINFIIFIILAFDFIFIRVMNFDSTLVWTIFNALYIITFVIYLMMNLYIYPLMVTFELNIRNLLKNAFMFALGRFFTNLVILVIVFGLVTLPFMYLQPFAAVIASFILFYGVLGFLQSFNAHRAFKKYYYDKMPKKADEEQDDSNLFQNS